MKKRNYLLLILGILFCIPCIAFAAGEEITASLTDFPNLMPNAAISIQPSEFGPERMNAVCYGTGKEKPVTYRLFKKLYNNKGDESLFEVTPPQPDSAFDLFVNSWDQCDAMIAGYNEKGEVILASPKKHVDISRLNRQPASPQPQSSTTKRDSSSPLNIDASQFPLIRIQGVLPEQNQARSADAQPVVEESGISQKILDYARSSESQTADILLLVSNSAGMNYNATWFMPKLRNFLRHLSDSGMNYRIGLVPFGSAEQTAAYMEKGTVFYKNAGDLLSVLENKLTFDSPYDDAVSAVQKAIASSSWNSSAKKIIILAGNQAVSTDRAQSREITAAIQKQNIRFFAFLPEQSFLTQLLTRRTAGGFLNFYNEELTTILSDLSPSASSVSLSFRTDQLAGQGARQVSLYYTGTDAASRSKRSEPVSFTYTPPTPFDLMLMPVTEALVKESQERHKPMEIQVKVMKQDPDTPDPVLTLHYTDSGKSDYKTTAMTKLNDDDVYVAAVPAEDMAVFGINYYITADAADYRASLPPRNTEEQPFSVAVVPNEMPWYRLDLSEEMPVPGNSFKIGGEFHADQQIIDAVLYYRPKGESEYAEIKNDFGFQQPEFEIEIPGASVTAEGLEYYIAVRDNKGVITYVGDMTQPMYIKAEDPAAISRKASRSEPVFKGEGFDVWADQIAPFDDGGEPGAQAATGHVFIGKSGGEPMLRFEDIRDGKDVGMLLISPDKTKFAGYGTLYASKIATQKNPTPYDAPLYKGWFARNPDDEAPDELSGESDLSLQLQVTPDNEKIAELAVLAAFRARYTSNSKIEVDKTKVTITGSGIDFSFAGNKIIKLVDFLGVSKISSCVWSRNKFESASKETISLNTIKLGSFDLFSGSATLDLINWGLEISAGGWGFGKLCNFDAKKFPVLSYLNVLKGFTIGVQINPMAITRLALNLSIPAPISSKLTVPNVTYSGIPIGIAPTDLGLDLKNLGFVVPPSAEVTLSGKVSDNFQAIDTIEKFTLGKSFVSGDIMVKLDLAGTLSSKGKVSLLSMIDLGGYYGHLSLHSPQIKFKAYANAPVAFVNIRLDVDFEAGYNYNSRRAFFAGSGKVGVGPPSFIVSAARLVGVSLSNLVNVKVSASGAVGGGAPSLKVGGELSVAKYPCPEFRENCFNKCISLPIIGTNCARVCVPLPSITMKDFNIGATVTFLPKPGVSVAHREDRYLSEPGIERVLAYTDLEGEQVPVMVEFNYGRAIKVFSGNGQRDSGTTSPYQFNLPAEYDHALIRVTSDTGVPQVKATMSWVADEAFTPIIYTSLVNTNPDSLEDAMVFSSSEEDHETLGIIKTPVIGDYIIEILNPGEIGNFKIEVTVPNQAPSLEITSAKLVGGTDTEDILEVTYTLTDPDTENPFVTFRLSDQPDKADTALFLFPEGVTGAEADSEKLIGQATEKTVRLVVDRNVLKSDRISNVITNHSSRMPLWKNRLQRLSTRRRTILQIVSVSI